MESRFKFVCTSAISYVKKREKLLVKCKRLERMMIKSANQSKIFLTFDRIYLNWWWIWPRFDNGIYTHAQKKFTWFTILLFVYATVCKNLPLTQSGFILPLELGYLILDSQRFHCQKCSPGRTHLGSLTRAQSPEWHCLA